MKLKLATSKALNYIESTSSHTTVVDAASSNEIEVYVNMYMKSFSSLYKCKYLSYPRLEYGNGVGYFIGQICIVEKKID